MPTSDLTPFPFFSHTPARPPPPCPALFCVRRSYTSRLKPHLPIQHAGCCDLACWIAHQARSQLQISRRGLDPIQWLRQSVWCGIGILRNRTCGSAVLTLGRGRSQVRGLEGVRVRSGWLGWRSNGFVAFLAGCGAKIDGEGGIGLDWVVRIL